MTDLDKMARELLSGGHPRKPGFTVTRRQAELAIRAALLAAPPGYVLVDRATLLEMRDVAMRWTRSGRLPECGAFSRIAQDADAMLAAAPEVKR